MYVLPGAKNARRKKATRVESGKTNAGNVSKLSHILTRVRDTNIQRFSIYAGALKARETFLIHEDDIETLRANDENKARVYPLRALFEMIE